MSEIYIINDVQYNKIEIDESPELKKELFKQLKRDHYRNVCRETARIYRINNREKVNEYNREYQRNKYHNDENYRNSRLNNNKEYLEKKGLNLDSFLLPKLSRGRPNKFKLNENFELITV